MTELIHRKKIEKRTRLLNASLDLFKEKGVSATSIAQICQKANIAKGTFYLYYKDKEDILRALTKRISSTIIEDAYEQLGEKKGFIEDAIGMADYLMNMFQNDPGLVELLKKDFVWPIGFEEFMHTDNPSMVAIREEIRQFAEQSGLGMQEILFRLYALISMICSVCYSSIIDDFPSDIHAFREEIFSMIRGSFQK